MANLRPVQTLPTWLPDAVRLYLDHTEEGLSLRELARREGCHASTVMRQVRRYENRRDDPLIDAALAALARAPKDKEDDMTIAARSQDFIHDEARIAAEARRVLRRMAESGAVLGFAADMEKAAVLRTFPDGQTAKTAVVDREVAQAFALKNWIAPRKAGRITTYEITSAGRAYLRQAIEEEDGRRRGMSEAGANFNWGEEEDTRRLRYGLGESPVAAMGRRRDKDGKPLLEPELVAAAERIREDFELAQMGPRVTQNWDRFLDGGAPGLKADPAGRGPGAARDRVALALQELGPGLNDMVLRCCCHLEGVEATEKALNWPARSGKVVLRIALERLRQHYQRAYGGKGPLIG
ncbi:DUF6456 domain-containing protein [Cereibacter sp. SYSU M97828]|nr:DUF6456 domain-containing protein [Cereibacter flavus]